jgi:ABC-type lipoprotein release transport system permease subunit
MMLLVKLGYRNIWRNRRRTFLTMSAMAVATMMVILMLGIFDGMLWSMIDNATQMYHGHIKISAKGYFDERKVHQTIDENGLSEAITSNSLVTGVAGRVRGFMLLSCGEGDDSHTQPAEMFGIDPAEERNVTKLETQVKVGTFVTGSATHEIVLGNGLALRLEASVGDEIVAMGQASDGSIAADIFHVTGIINTSDPLRDASLAVVGRKTLQTMMVLEGQLHEWAISLDRPIGAKQWADEFQKEHDDIEVLPWTAFLPTMGQSLEMMKAMKMVLGGIFYFAVILVAVNTLYMAFFERLREFGIMGAVGMKKSRLSLMILLEGFFLSGIAGITGGTAGNLISWYLSENVVDLSALFPPISYAGTVFLPELRCYLAVENMLIPVVMMILLGMVVALFPAHRIMKLKPVDVLREV